MSFEHLPLGTFLSVVIKSGSPIDSTEPNSLANVSPKQPENAPKIKRLIITLI